MTKHPALIKTVVLLFALVFAMGLNGRTQNSPTEYQIKAAFIYNFTRFVDWPTQAFADASSPMTIGVLGKNVFGDNLQQAISGKTIMGHVLQFRQFDAVTDVTNCQVLFISDSEKSHLSRILSRLQGAYVLTVSENTEDFIGAGGMINLVIMDNKVRFEINNDAAKKAGLTISSKLLSLAINSP
jgi:YfiR/HmsC-like